MNTDFFKNISIPPIQLPKVPKLKTRKIFTTTTSTATTVVTGSKITNEFNVGAGGEGPKPKPLVVAPPAKLSTISSLVDGAPTYDYSFGGATVSESLMNKIEEENEKELQKITKQSSDIQKNHSRKISKRLSKQYKELSEFKFKDIFGKKTVVRTTEIQPSTYVQNNNGENTLESRYQFNQISYNSDIIEFEEKENEISSSKYFGNKSENLNQALPKKRHFLKKQSTSIESSSSSPKKYFSKAASLQALSGILPNESSLWGMKKFKSKDSVDTLDNSRRKTIKEKKDKDKGKEDKDDKTNRLDIRSISRQDIDVAFDKAKKSVNSKIRQLKLLQSRTLGSRDSSKSSKKSKEAVKEVINRRGSFDSFDSEKQLREIDISVLKDEWITRRKLSSSFDSDEIPRCLLGPQDSVEETQAIAEVCIVSHPVSLLPQREFESYIEEIDDSKIDYNENFKEVLPEIPKRIIPPQQEWIPNNQIIVAFYQPSSSNSPNTRKSIFPEFPKGHSSKLSIDSTDSDSWIPEKLKGMTRNQIAFNKISETDRAWEVNNERAINSHVQRLQSVDIFNPEGEEAFDDFDKVLRNVPVITIKTCSNNEEVGKLYNQGSLDFSTEDDEENEEEEDEEIDPDISTVYELPQDIVSNVGSLDIDDVPMSLISELYSENIDNSNFENITKVISGPKNSYNNIETPIIIETFSSPINTHDKNNNNELEKKESSELSQCNEMKLKSDGVLTQNENENKNEFECNKFQFKKSGISIIKQESLRRKFSDDLETENLQDINVNKLISRFENRKSNSSSGESPTKFNNNKITVKAIIESKGYEEDVEIIDLPVIKSVNIPTSTLLESSEKDNNENINYCENTLNSCTEKINSETIKLWDKPYSHNNSIDNINIKDKNVINDKRRKSLEWIKSSKSINKTIDLQDPIDDEVFYSFEDDEDSRRLNKNSCNNSNNSINSLKSSTIPIPKITTTFVGTERTVRHVYNVVL